VDFIVPLLNVDSVRVRGAAALALRVLGDPRAVEPLKAARKRLRRSPFEWYLHHRVYNEAIKKLQDAA
jgi:HEAT repeat protein